MQYKITKAIDALILAAVIEGGVSDEKLPASRELTNLRKSELMEAISAPCLHQIQEPAENKLLEAKPAFYTAIAEHDGDWIPLPEYSAQTSDGVLQRVLLRAREEGYQGGNALERLKELGWAYRPVYFAVDPARVAPLPLLMRDIAREHGITALEACQALKDLGNFSVNTAVTAEMAAKLRELFPVPQAAPAAVAVPAKLPTGDEIRAIARSVSTSSSDSPSSSEYVMAGYRAALAATPAAAPMAKGYDSGIQTGNRVTLIFETQDAATAWFESFSDAYDTENGTRSIALPIPISTTQAAAAVDKSPELQGSMVDKTVNLQGAASAPVVLPEPDAAIKEVMGLVDEWGMESHLRGEAELDAQHSEATQEEIDCAKDRASKERAAWKAIESKLRALLATATGLPAQAVEVDDRMALAFHHAITDGAIGQDDLNEIKIGLRAVLVNLHAPQAQADARDAGNEWQEISTMPTCDDLIWLYCQETNTIDGPIAPDPSLEQFGWTHWAYANAPSTERIDRAAIAAAKGD